MNAIEGKKKRLDYYENFSLGVMCGIFDAEGSLKDK
jgi:hypothetical protein